MNEKYTEFFKSYLTVDVPQGLESDIRRDIHRRHKRNVLLKQSVYGGVSLISFAGIIALGSYVTSILSTSGAYDYISLLFVDSEVVVYWKELAFSIAESLPFVGLALLCGASALCIWSGLRVFKVQLSKRAVLAHY